MRGISTPRTKTCPRGPRDRGHPQLNYLPLSRLYFFPGVTTSVTGTTRGELPASLAAMETLPLYVPAASPDGLTETVMLPGVWPSAGVAKSHAAELPVDTLKPNASPVLTMAMV